MDHELSADDDNANTADDADADADADADDERCIHVWMIHSLLFLIYSHDIKPKVCKITT